ncbi:hypothetical protein ABIB38_001455 [Massilia sp. UYP11]|uniref:hypothetical protein n=1 Tax=Massilia sp. UYP11 TaxID=1756385 RepID=UPI003D2070CF
MQSLDTTNTRYITAFHLEQVCFERIFDAPGRTGYFSFEAAGKRQYGVMLPDGEVPREGAHYAVVLAEKDNWQAIMAWRDLSTPHVYIRETAWQVVRNYAWLGYVGMPAVLGVTLVAFGGWAALAVLALMLWGGAAYLRHVIRRNRRIEQALLDVPPQAPPGMRCDHTVSWRTRVIKALATVF